MIFCNKDKFWTALVVELLEPRFAARTTREWLARLSGSVPCAPVNTMQEALDDEQVRQRQMILEVAHPRFGVLREVASPIKTAGAIASPAPAPALGEHTNRLLSELLHYPPERIAALRAAGVLGDAGLEATAS